MGVIGRIRQVLGLNTKYGSMPLHVFAVGHNCSIQKVF